MSLSGTLARFQDPTKRRKRREAKEKQEAEKRHKMRERNKLYAKNCFNNVLTPLEYNVWKHELLPEHERKWRASDLATLYAQIRDNELDEVCSEEKSGDGIFSILFYFAVEAELQKWLQARLREIGWKQNMTNYHAVQACDSASELPRVFVEIYRMAIKQMQRLTEYEAALTPTQNFGN